MNVDWIQSDSTVQNKWFEWIWLLYRVRAAWVSKQIYEGQMNGSGGKKRKLHLIRSTENVQVSMFEAVKRANNIISSGGRKPVWVCYIHLSIILHF